MIVFRSLYTLGDCKGASGSGIPSLQLLGSGLADALYSIEILGGDESSEEELLRFAVDLA